MKLRLPVAIALALTGSAMLLSSESVFAITDLETNAAIPFSFANPGARSLGMAGAFVGLADDATAAYTNPAGLTQLVQTEVSLEGRRVETNSPFTSGGSATFNPLATTGIEVGNTKNTNSSPSFISLVLPRGDWSFAFYRHELAKFNTSFSAGGTLLPNYLVNGQPQEVIPFDGAADLHIVDYGLAIALKANEMISVGVGVSYYDFSLTSLRVAAFNGNLVNAVADSGSDHGLAGTLGLRLRFNDQWSAGFAYRVNPRFSYKEIVAVPDSSGGIVSAGGIRGQFKVPDVISAGVSYHPTDQLVINFDVDRVFYSQLTGKLTSVFGDVPPSTLEHLNVPNGTEAHVGAEYTFANFANPLSIRGGIWHDPRHTIQFDGQPANGPDLIEAVVFGGGYGSKTHASLGGGVVIPQLHNLQLDAAYDWSDKIKTASLSAVYRF
ncbi:MAG: outer membrane protein transport protein [Rudaea sp.]